MYYPYILVYSFILASFYVSERVEKSFQYQHILHTIFNYRNSFVLLFLFAAFRGNGDGDYFNYLSRVHYIKSFKDVLYIQDYPFELGFRLLAWFTNVFKLPNQTVIASMNLISMLMLHTFIKKTSKNTMFSLVILFPFVLLYDMHHSRSAIAMSASLLVFYFAHEKKYTNMILSFIVGFIFHKSAIISVIFALVSQIDHETKFQKGISIKFKSIIILCLVLLSIYGEPFVIVANIFNRMGFTRGYVKIVAYLSDPQWSYPFSLLDPRFWLLMYIFFSYSSSSLYRHTKTNKFAVMNFLAIASVILFRESTMLVMRIYNFFNLFNIVLVPNFSVEENKRATYNQNFFEVIFIKNFKITFLIIYITYTILIISKSVPYLLWFKS